MFKRTIDNLADKRMTDKSPLDLKKFKRHADCYQNRH